MLCLRCFFFINVFSLVKTESFVVSSYSSVLSYSYFTAVFDAQDLNGVVVCILSSSDAIDSSDVHSVLQYFRQTTECNGAVIISKIHEANLEPNLIVTTVITLG